MDNKQKLEKIIGAMFSQGKQKFIPGKTFIPTGQAVYDEHEIISVVESLLSRKLGLNTRGLEFENKFAEYTHSKSCVLTNSGSSASLLALDSIKNVRSLKGGEVITPACGFPTTINPILQLGFTPVFTDVDKDYNLSPELLSEAITPETVGVVFAHTLGNPARVKEIMEIANQRGLFVLEDCCDAYGSEYQFQKCGSFGTVSTFSFYPAHSITLGGEGGAVNTNNLKIDKMLRSLRDWGRDCTCLAGEDNRCGRRFGFSLGDIPYDHKYIYSTLGYNLKPTEMQAAMGLVQLGRIEKFNEQRKENYQLFSKALSELGGDFDFIKVNQGADPVLFGFPLKIKNSKINRQDLVRYLNDSNIGTRYVFGGNLTLHPAYKNAKYRVSGKLEETNEITRNSFWMGIHPGMNEEMIEYVAKTIKFYLESKS